MSVSLKGQSVIDSITLPREVVEKCDSCFEKIQILEEQIEAYKEAIYHLNKELALYAEVTRTQQEINEKEFNKCLSKIPRKKSFALGITGGYGINRDGLRPFIGFGLSIPIIRF